MKDFFKKIFSLNKKYILLGGVVFSLIVAFILAAIINWVLCSAI